MKILLLEDNKKLNQSIKKRLEYKKYEIDCFLDGKEAYDNIGEGYSCFVLDINVPNLDGVELLRRIREYYEDVPVIIISATVELDVIKKAYGFGCSDFIKKPFFIDELEIKIEKLCNISDNIINFGENSFFDYKSSIINIDEKEVRLTKKERLLLSLFLNQKNQVVTFDNIQNYVWEGNVASLESIRSLIRRVRKLLIEDYIQTVVDTGYIFKD
jgi:DNA-binding response OmpR family regulator